MKKRGIARLSLIFLAFSFISLPLATETVRERANIHFAMSRWAVQAEALPHTELPSTKVTGGDESFAVLAPSRTSDAAAIYPEAEGLGSIDYSGISRNLCAFLDEVAKGLQGKTVNSARCTQDRAFLTTLTEYKLARLPDIAQVLYSRPESLGTELRSVRFRLDVKQGTSRKLVFITVILAGTDESPVIDDIILDGPSYADAAQQD